MDSEEEKTEIHTTSQSSTTLSQHSRSNSSHVYKRRLSCSLPLDLEWEILLRIPAKSVTRYRSVSKLWYKIITHQDFINSFHALPSASSPRVLLTFQKSETLFVFSFPQHQDPADPYSNVERYEVTYPNDIRNFCSESVHGLTCFKTSTQLVVWNPTTRWFLPLPEHESGLKWDRGLLGYDPIGCKYKVLSFVKDEEIHVLTLGAQDSWRMIKAIPVHSPTPTKGYAQCVNGILYYIAHVGVHVEDGIMSFDLRFEMFNLIEFPIGYHSPGILVTYEGKLALVSSKETGVAIWILEDAENRKWSYEHFHYPPPERKWRYLDLKGVTDAGELVYTDRSLYESFHVVYFNLKRKSFRETKFEQIASGMFRVLKGLGLDPLEKLKVFPNHTESLFSF